MSEKSIENRIKKLLKEEGFWFFKVHGGPYQRVGIPDLLAVRDGRLLAIEVKRPGGVVSPAQVAVINELQKAGAVAGVASSVEEARELMEKVR